MELGKGLNGWQRLWLFIGVLYALIVLVITALSWPPADSGVKTYTVRDNVTGDTVTVDYYGVLAPDEAVLTAIHLRELGEHFNAVVERFTREAPDGLNKQQFNALLGQAIADEETRLGISKNKSSAPIVDPFDQYLVTPGYPDNPPTTMPGWVIGLRARYSDHYRDLSDAAFRTGIEKKYPLKAIKVEIEGRAPIYFPEGTWELTMEQAVNRRINGPWAERWSVIGWAILAWFLPMGFVYALGWGLLWVARGFRHSANSK